MTAPAFQPRAGSALIIVLWSIITMSVVVLGLVEFIHYNLDETKSLNLDFELRQLATSGLGLAFSPDIQPGDPVLNGKIGDNGGEYEVILDDETSRLNINRLLLTGQDDLLERLFVTWKVPSSESRTVIQDLVRWVGRTGDSPENYSLEREFTSVLQMREVEQMAKIDRRHPEWPDAFTIWGDGKLDINDASPDVLQAFFGIGERRALSFVQSHLGPDKTPHTLDDQPYTDMKILAGALGMTEKQFEPYVQRVSLETQLTRAECTGILDGHKRQIRVIFNRKAQPPIIYQWQEVPI